MNTTTSRAPDMNVLRDLSELPTEAALRGAAAFLARLAGEADGRDYDPSHDYVRDRREG